LKKKLFWLTDLTTQYNYIYQSTDSLCIIPEKSEFDYILQNKHFQKKIKIITSEKNLLLPKIDTSWTKEIVAALYILLLQYVCNKKNINVRLPFCVEASQKTNFERKFNN